MRASAWFTAIVTLAVAAGLLAFLAATPDPSTRARPERPGFGGLSKAQVDARMGDAAAYHAALHRTTVTDRSAAANGLAWLTAIAGSRGRAAAALPRLVRSSPASPLSKARVLAFAAWADDIPAGSWRVQPRATARRPAAVGADAYAVASYVDVYVAQAAGPRRHQRIPVTVQLQGSGGTATAAPRRWLLRDVVVGGPRTFLRAYVDPVVVHRPSIDVVAPSSERVAAVRLADAGQAELLELRERYPGLGSPASVTAWLLDDGRDARRVLGAPPPPATLTAGTGTPHAGSWLTPSGDVAIELHGARLPPEARADALRRELTLVTLRDVASHAPPALLEGVAAREVRRGRGAAPAGSTPAGTTAATEFAPLAAALRRGDAGVDELLRAPAGGSLAPGATPAERRNASLAAEAIVGWIEGRDGHAAVVRLLARLRSGASMPAALRDVLDVDVVAVEHGVATWTTHVVGPPSVPIARASGIGGATTTGSTEGTTR